MKKLRLLNRSEYLTDRVLRRALQGTSYSINAQVPLSKVIQREKGETLSRAEKNFLNTSEIDFIVYDGDSLPQLAIEFDGPAHEAYEDQQARDIRKNRLCRRAGLPLIRIGDIHLEEHDKTTLLEYIVTRYVCWQAEKDEILREISEYVTRLPEEELERLTEGGVLDPEIDPTCIFDLRHPFPSTNERASKLYEDFGIVSPHLDSESWQHAIQQPRVLELCPVGAKTEYQGHHIQETRDYALLERTRTADGPGYPSPIHQIQVSFRVRWTLPAVNDYDDSDAPMTYALKTGRFPIAYQNVPGISMPQLAENFCDYVALKKIEDWARDNPSKMTTPT
jgi:very-short-patch-repair endonuclease